MICINVDTDNAAQVCYEGANRVYTQRNSWRNMQIPFGCPNHDDQNTQSRLLLVNHGSKLSDFRQKMHTMSETRQSHSQETRAIALHNLPVTICKVGDGYLRTVHPGKGQVKFLIVGIDYFTKWIEAKPLATITAQQIQQFVWKNIICWYGVPHTIITDNDQQFIDKELVKFYTSLGIKISPV